MLRPGLREGRIVTEPSPALGGRLSRRESALIKDVPFFLNPLLD